MLLFELRVEIPYLCGKGECKQTVVSYLMVRLNAYNAVLNAYSSHPYWTDGHIIFLLHLSSALIEVF